MEAAPPSSTYVDPFRSVQRITSTFTVMKKYGFVALDFVMNNHLYKWVGIPGCAIIYWGVYRGAKDAYVSHIYHNDKYGVVINYAVLVGVKLFYEYSDILRLLVSPTHGLPGTAALAGELKDNDLTNYINASFRALVARGLFAFSKIWLCNFLFKNNTEYQLVTPEEKLHGLVHKLGVFGLGVTSLLGTWFGERPAPKPAQRYLASPTTWRPLYIQMGIMAISGALFGLCLSKSKDKTLSRTMKTWWSGWSICFESILISATI